MLSCDYPYVWEVVRVITFNALLGSIRIKPELKGNIQNLGGNGDGGTVGVHLDQGGQLGGVTNHVGITKLVTCGLGQLVPDVEPRIIFVLSNKARLYLKQYKNIYYP